MSEQREKRGLSIPADAVKEAASVAVMRVLGVPNAAALEDACSAAWLMCCEREHRYSPEKGTHRQFFWRVAFCAAIDHLRGEIHGGMKTETRAVREEGSPYHFTQEPGGHAAVELRERADTIDKTIDAMDARKKKAVALPKDVLFRLFIEWKAGVSVKALAQDPECTVSSTQLFERFSEIERQL